MLLDGQHLPSWKKKTYPQLVDIDRNNSPLLYGISGVPRVLLIDRNGIILGYFRGEELIEAVEKAL